MSVRPSCPNLKIQKFSKRCAFWNRVILGISDRCDSCPPFLSNHLKSRRKFNQNQLIHFPSHLSKGSLPNWQVSRSPGLQAGLLFVFPFNWKQKNKHTTSTQQAHNKHTVKHETWIRFQDFVLKLCVRCFCENNFNEIIRLAVSAVRFLDFLPLWPLRISWSLLRSSFTDRLVRADHGRLHGCHV